MAVTVTTDGPSAFHAIALPPQTLERLVSRFGGVGVRPDLDRLKGGILRNALIDTLCRRLWQEAEQDGPLGRLASDGALMLLVAELLREAGPAAAPARGGLAPWQVNRAKDFMRADLSRDTPVSDLAGLLGLSVHHFCRMFKHSTGMSPHQWLIAQRMDRARHLLMEPDRSLGEVARAVGYANATAFATAFRRVTGTTPSDWRRQSGLR